MKKTLIINIGNTIIHFEEDAFEALTSYLNGIKAHFSSTADNFEIVTDIENRIAELLKEILSEQQKQVVSLEDANAVMNRMGNLSDFEDQEQPDTAQNSGEYRSFRRLFRDTDERMIAGVCSGLSHYLKIDIVWVRLLFLISITLGGAGVLAYIIMWIVVPPARTRSEKMGMKGETADLQGFKRNFEEEMAAFKEQMQHANAQFQPYVKRTGNALSDFMGSLGKVIESAAKIFFKIIALMIITMGVGMMLALIVTLAIALGAWDSNLFDYFPFTIINNGDEETLLFSAFVTCMIPLLALVLLSIRVAFNRKAINKTLSFALLTIWLCGVSFTAYYISRITTEFKEHAELTQTETIKTLPAYTLELDELMNIDQSKWYGSEYQMNVEAMDGRRIVYDSDHPFRAPRNVSIDIEKSNSPSASLTRYYEAQGRDFKTAVQNAQAINYTFTQKDSVLTFSPALTVKNAVNWRAQEVHLILKVPVGTVLRVNDTLYPYLNYYNWDCMHNDNSYTDWVMTEDGLKCKEERVHED